jgi:hypothetical protein
MTNDHDNAQPERPAGDAEREAERLANREPTSPGEKQATELAREGLEGWRDKGLRIWRQVFGRS